MSDEQEPLDDFQMETDDELIERGEQAFDDALYVIHSFVDPGFTFIVNNFNRRGLDDTDDDDDDDPIDTVSYIDKAGIPTIGVNYKRFAQCSPITQVGLIEHNVGHFMSGHVGNRLGNEMREYCVDKYGAQFGKRLYYTAIDCVADSFISYPDAMRADGREVYDVKKLGLDRWSHTVTVLKRIEELVENEAEKIDASELDPDTLLNAALDAVAEEMGVKNPSKKPGDGDDLSDGGETGGANTHDRVRTGNKAEAMMGEDKIRDIVKRAVENTESTSSRGWLSGDAGQFIEADEYEPVIPWFQEINHVVSAVLSDERQQSRKRQNRRAPDIEQWPGRVSRGTTQIVFLIDTSGSMGTEDLAKVNSQLDFCAQQADTVYVGHVDAEVAHVEEYYRGMCVEEFFGRGGTCFTPGLEHIRDEFVPENSNVWPNAVVYFTDGFGEKLDDDNPIIGDWETELVWVLTPDGRSEEDFRDEITNTGLVVKVEEW
jgi:predicted metal-dependent peptidase